MRALALAFVACGTAAAPPRNTIAPAGPPLVRARAFELGTGVPRDYTAAAAIYRTECNDGRGDADACRGLILALMSARGVAFDKAAAGAVATTVCVTKHDAFACTVADMVAPSERDLDPAVLAAVKDALAGKLVCDEAHLSACWAMLLGSAFDFGGGTSAEERRQERAEQMCRAGIADGCERARAGRDPDVKAYADTRLAELCDGGDADACDDSPDRASIAPDKLCAAGDYSACAAQACLGDAGAAKLARDHFATPRHPCAHYAKVQTGAQAISALAPIADQMCACTNAACADAAEASFEAWANVRDASGGKTFAKERDELERLIERLAACRARLAP